MVSMKFTPTPEKKKLRVDINENVFQELELYLICAKETYPWLQLDMVVEQLLDDALKKDRDFRSWLKKHRKHQPQDGQGDSHPGTPDNGNQPTPAEEGNQPVMLAEARHEHGQEGHHWQTGHHGV